MLNRSRSDIWLLVVAVAITRIGFRSHFLYDLDSLGFALGVEHFDPRVYQPHPPGYFLYICLGKLFHALVPDVNLALVALSIAASCGAAALIYRMAQEWFGIEAARFAGLIFLFSPLAWFHGVVALTYIVEAFFSALIGYLCWQIESGNWRLILPTSLILGISAGVRPSSLLFLGPLFLFSLRKAGWKRGVIAISSLLVMFLAWFLPMISASGGYQTYFGALFSLWRMVPSRDTVFNSNPATSIARALAIAFILLLCFGTALSAALWRWHADVPSEPQKKKFTLAWIGPALCFFTFIFLKFVNSGYLLVISAPLSIWLGAWAADWYAKTAWARPWKLAIVSTGIAVNCAIFLASPLYCSYRLVRRHEAEIRGVRSALSRVASPEDTLIVGFDSHFLGYRDAGYYLPGYLSVEYPAVKLLEGTRVFAMEHQQTRLLTALPARSYTRFVLFPLPAGDPENQAYLRKVQALIPPQDQRTISMGGRDFITGPIADLPLLFPTLGWDRVEGVSTLRQSPEQPVNSRVHPPSAVPATR
jgi:4-amino-4-deoxy-L-arabinose transferase-like glycosyltransferase